LDILKDGVGLEIDDAGLRIGGVPITAPSVAQIAAVLGQPRRVDKNGGILCYWDRIGLRARTANGEEILDLYILLHENPENAPLQVFPGRIVLDGRDAADILNKTAFANHIIVLHTGGVTINFYDHPNPVTRKFENFCGFCSIDFPKPGAAFSETMFDYPADPGPLLGFSNLNWKLLIVEELMYVQHKLKPEFDINAFARIHEKRGNIFAFDSRDNIPEAEAWFEALPVPARLAPLVEKLVTDGGNSVYPQICPAWDGEDDRFDITSITKQDLAQFPNLKKISNISMLYPDAETEEALRNHGVNIV